MPLDPFDYAILDQTSHRPWPMPSTPWVMTQSWHDLLFAHWPVDAARLASQVPAALELDRFDGVTWLGIVPFHMTNVAPRAVPSVPWISAFPELNVRTYVRVGDKPGVYFFSLDAGSAVAVALARALFNLPYYRAIMEVASLGDTVSYHSRRVDAGDGARFAAEYQPEGAVRMPRSGTLEHFLTERYCLYSVDGGGRPRRVDIHHPPWPLQTATATIRLNTMAEANRLALPDQPPLLHFAKRQDVVAWLPAAAAEEAP